MEPEKARLGTIELVKSLLLRGAVFLVAERGGGGGGETDE
jgi:hypothetical protein